jgi:phosphohistidine swiveling domain-containing protein
MTKLSGFDPISGEFNDSLTGDYAWSCVNIGEAMSVVMTPFTWSILRMCYDELAIVPGYAAAGNIGGRAYQNITVMTAILRVMGRNTEDMVKELGGTRGEYLERLDEYLTPLPGVTFLTVLPNVIRMFGKQWAALQKLDAFLAENPPWCQAMCQRIQAVQTQDELTVMAKLISGEVLDRTLRTFWRAVATAWLQGERVGKLRRELTGRVGGADADALLSSVSRQGEMLASLGPVVGLSRVARGEMSRDAYLEQWGHRGPLESETFVPRPAEDPDWLERQLAAFAASPVDVEGLLAARRAGFDAAWKRFQDRYPRQAGKIRQRLDQAASASRLREAVRSELARLVGVARAWALCVGKLTGIDDGAFFLTFDEQLDLVAGKDVPTATIPARRQTYERYKALPPYPLIIRGRFDPFQWAADPNRRSDVFDARGVLPRVELKDRSATVIVGMPGSAGRVEGIVRRLDDPEEGHALQPGEILVTAQTNIGWTLLFPRAGAIVTDVGAPLSHAAVVARELGIPAVVNCGDATARLRTGDRVRVDGLAGTIEIVKADQE